MDDNPLKDDSKYLKGKENWLIRAYFYCSNGLIILNEFRNLFLGIIAIYITLKITNLYAICGIMLGSIIILTLVGYYRVHRMAKKMEYISTRFSTSFGIRSFNYTMESYNLLVEILKELKDANNNKR
jgi:hypothetical protein